MAARTEDTALFPAELVCGEGTFDYCEGTVGDIKDPINTCDGAIRKGSFDDYCYEDLLYDSSITTVQEAADLYQERKDAEEGELCPSDRIDEAYNKIEGTQGQGIFVIDFNKDCDSEEECAASCPWGGCVYPDE